jgi:hypothetical protein
MKNQDKPAMPITGMDHQHLGLTKLEAFTMAALQGVCVPDDGAIWTEETPKALGEAAVEIAKATLKALEEQA